MSVGFKKSAGISILACSYLSRSRCQETPASESPVYLFFLYIFVSFDGKYELNCLIFLNQILLLSE